MVPTVAYRLKAHRSQLVILSSFLAFQTLDAITTHLGLGLRHPEINQIMASVLSGQGELVAYALKGITVGILLAILMLLRHNRPRVWQAFYVAAWLSAAVVIANLYQIVSS